MDEGEVHRFLSRLRELENAAERWRAAVAQTRRELEERVARDKSGSEARAARRSLCEAEDPYWYL